MSDKKTAATLERLNILSSQNKCEVGSYVEDLKKRVSEINRGELRKSSNFFKALGDESRLKMIYLLEKRDMCVCELVASLELSQPTTSHHLKILETAGLIERKKKGKWAFYGIRNPETSNYIKNAPI
jgi:ArsR family transcriptional regulator